MRHLQSNFVMSVLLMATYRRLIAVVAESQYLTHFKGASPVSDTVTVVPGNEGFLPAIRKGKICPITFLSYL
jgi:hypothetical protein